MAGLTSDQVDRLVNAVYQAAAGAWVSQAARWAHRPQRVSGLDIDLEPATSAAVLTGYLRHYNTARPHRGIRLQVPTPISQRAAVGPPTHRDAPVERVDVLGGLIHEYRRAA